MRCKRLFLLIVVFSIISINFISADFEFNGTVNDINGVALNSTNVTVLIRDQSWVQVWTNTSVSNSSGWFNITLPNNTNYFYQVSLVHSNSTLGFIDYVGQSLPALPYQEVSQLSGTNFYLKDAGTINITTINGSNDRISFSYQVKDVKLGYPVSGCTSNAGNNETICHVPRDRNYSVMIYPSGSENFVPVSFDWNNFSSSSSYNISNLSSYNATSKVLNKQFNVTESFARITGYINGSTFNINGWSEFTLVPLLLEPGNMVFMSFGTLPYNASAWNSQTDEYNLTTGWYNISVPYAPSESVSYILYASAKNGSAFYGGYANITVSGKADINFTMYGLLGNNETINMSNANGGRYIVNTSKQTFWLINSTNSTLSQASAHVEATVDYSNYGAIEFTFMEEISQTGNASFLLPLLNVTGIKEINIYSQSFAPKRIGTRSAAQIVSNPNITMAAFSPGDIDGSAISSSVYINLYKSNSTCDVPNPPSGCSLTDSSNMDNFKPLSAVMGGGAISFRMGLTSTGIEIHYVNVDMMASGPPDALFDDSATESTSGGFASVLRFGSNGPTIYDYVMISMPYTEGSTSTTGLNESEDVNMSIPLYYDENWNVIWNASANGSSGAELAANDSHYSTYQSDWSILMNDTNCTRTVSEFNASRPCYLDTANNKIWVRLPHFSGTQPNVAGGVTTVESSSTSTSSSGGSASTSFWSNTYVPDDNDLEKGYIKELAKKQRVKLKVGSSTHYVGVVDISQDDVIVNISSDPVQVKLEIGDDAKVDVSEDNYYDVYVKLLNISNNKANITIQKIHEEVPEGAGAVSSSGEVTDGVSAGNETIGAENGEEPKKKSYTWLWIILTIVIILIIIGVGIWIQKVRRKKYGY